MMAQKIMLLFCLGIILSCNSSKQSTESDNSKEEPSSTECSELVTAKDFSDLDGCSMMLINQKGEKLLLAENIPGYEIESGQQYKIGYVILEGMVSICMAENKVIKLNCIEVAGDQFSKDECVPSQNGFDDSFLKSLIDKNIIARIERFDYGNKWAYKVQSPYKSWLYNCKGIELCGGDLRTFSDCFATFKSELTNPKIIFQGEGPKE